MKRVILSAILCLFSVFSAFSQKMFSGVLIDSETKNPLVHAYIENTTRHIVVESNNDGKFEVFSHIGDTLVFSSIGYYWAKHIVTNDNNLTFNIEPQIYDIGLVTKYFPYSYEELTNKVLSLKPVDDTLQLNLSIGEYQLPNTHQAGQLSYTITGAITDIYNATNRHARNAIKAAELLSHKENILVINKKFNKNMVVEMTHVPENYFDTFIAFCDFSDDFLLKTSDFQIIMTLCWKYECFLNEYPELKNTL